MGLKKGMLVFCLAIFILVCLLSAEMLQIAYLHFFTLQGFLCIGFIRTVRSYLRISKTFIYAVQKRYAKVSNELSTKIVFRMKETKITY